MKRMLAVLLSLAMVLSFSAPAFAETTLEKINRTGVQPVAFINKNNEWLGFSIDLVEQTIAPEISKKLDNRDYDDAVLIQNTPATFHVVAGAALR